MNAWLTLAAVLTVLIGAAHSALGERHILVPLFRRGGLPPLLGSDVVTRRTLRLAWHLTTVAWWGAAAVFWALGEGNARLGVQVLSLTFLATAVVIGIGSRGRHLAWLGFAIIAAAAWLGAQGV